MQTLVTQLWQTNGRRTKHLCCATERVIEGVGLRGRRVEGVRLRRDLFERRRGRSRSRRLHEGRGLVRLGCLRLRCLRRRRCRGLRSERRRRGLVLRLLRRRGRLVLRLGRLNLGRRRLVLGRRCYRLLCCRGDAVASGGKGLTWLGGWRRGRVPGRSWRLLRRGSPLWWRRGRGRRRRGRRRGLGCCLLLWLARLKVPVEGLRGVRVTHGARPRSSRPIA